jgi:hypothetical protein
MGLQRGAKTPPRKHAYICSSYRNRVRTGRVCTTHYIRKSVILDLVLTDLRRVLQYVKEHEQEFISTANEYGQKETRKALANDRKELDKVKTRIIELDVIFRKLYEDNALGKLSETQFRTLTAGYEDEKIALEKKVVELENKIITVNDRKRDVNRFIQLVGKYSDIQELNYEILHEFIDKILIHELDREAKTRKIEIHYSFVGQIKSGSTPTEDITHLRKEKIDVLSYVI